MISSVLICNTNDAFGIEGAPEGAENEPLWDDWSEEVGWGREGDTRMCDEVASRLTGICREGDENVGWSEDEPSPLSAPCASGEASSSLSGTGESSLSGVSGRDGGGFSTAGSCWGLSEGSGDAPWECVGGAGAVTVLDTVGGADAASASPSR